MILSFSDMSKGGGGIEAQQRPDTMKQHVRGCGCYRGCSCLGCGCLGYGCSGCGCFVSSVKRVLKENEYWDSVIEGIKFLVHFVVVMAILFCGAVVFALLEESQFKLSGNDGDTSSKEYNNMNRNSNNNNASTNNSIYYSNNSNNNSNNNNNDTNTYISGSIVRINNFTKNIPNTKKPNSNKSNKRWNTTATGGAHHWSLARFWETLEDGFHMNISDDVKRRYKIHVTMLLTDITDTDATETNAEKNKHHSRRFLFMKWFYFVTTSVTTIGYGHVHPKTDNGKIFYIFFSVIGIALMMTLLKSCGNILNTLNEKLYCLLRRLVFKDKVFFSDELMSVVCIVIMFCMFMLLVVWHDQAINEMRDWTLIDCFYFWIVTFTTVGFGDVHFTLQSEIDHVYEMLFYRVFGLSFLAGIIESIQTYMRFRNGVIRKKISMHSNTIRDIVNRKRSLWVDLNQGEVEDDTLVGWQAVQGDHVYDLQLKVMDTYFKKHCKGNRSNSNFGLLLKRLLSE